MTVLELDNLELLIDNFVDLEFIVAQARFEAIVVLERVLFLCVGMGLALTNKSSNRITSLTKKDVPSTFQLIMLSEAGFDTSLLRR